MRFAAGILLSVVFAHTAGAQGLSWPAFAVTAHLDANGRLHVRERQSILFVGEWNGGERRFDVKFGQDFAFDSIVRIDSVTGARRRLVKGDLSKIDEYDWVGSRTLRWRSRLPSDPPFNSTTLVYELAFHYEDILKREGDSVYVLSHDFAFADRPSDIERFELTLTLDDAWRAPAGFTGRYSARVIPPGDKFVVTVPLTRVAVGTPSGVRSSAPVAVRGGLFALLLAGIAATVARWYMHDTRAGRFTKAVTPEEITPEWLQREVYSHLPEVVGTAWDDTTSQAEVAATLARLVQEKKLASRVEEQKGFMSSSHVLHLELLVPRNQLVEHERSLIDALFDDGAATTDTESVRKRYKTSGFDPAGVIRTALKKQANQLAPSGKRKGRSVERATTLALVVIALALLVAAAVNQRSDGLASLAVVGASIPAYIIALIVAIDLRNRMSNYGFSVGVLVVVGIAVLIAFSMVVLSDRVYMFGTLAIAGLVVWTIALVNSIGNIARFSLSPKRAALRKQLAAARAYFQRELDTAAPRMTDAAYPYLLAFGLGPHVDKWFKSFGGESTRMRTASSIPMGGGGSSSNSGGGSFTGFGGGGGFSGGGGGASFGAAVGGMAASIAAPSSSSSGGGGSSSSGGSSGGGGGGGW